MVLEPSWTKLLLGRAWTCLEPALTCIAQEEGRRHAGARARGGGASLKGFSSRVPEQVVRFLHLTRRSTPEGVRRIVYASRIPPTLSCESPVVGLPAAAGAVAAGAVAAADVAAVVLVAAAAAAACCCCCCCCCSCCCCCCLLLLSLLLYSLLLLAAACCCCCCSLLLPLAAAASAEMVPN